MNVRPVGARVALAALVLGVALACAAPASAFVPAEPGVHRWLFDHGGSVVNTPAEARLVADRYDVVIGSPAYAAFLGAMHAEKPGIVVALYANATSVGAAVERHLLVEHPGWILRGANGVPLYQPTFHSYLVDPGNPQVRAWRTSWAVDRARAGWDAIYLDQLGLWPLSGVFGGVPVNPRTGREFTDSEWLAATSTLAAQVRAATGKRVIGNGLKDGTAYFDFGTSTILDGVDAAVFEGCFRQAYDPVSQWPTITAWKQQMNAIRDVQARGDVALCMAKVWDPAATDAQRRQWHDFARASVLLAEEGSAFYFFTGSPAETALTSWGDDDPPVGSPAGPAERSGGGVMRPFTRGVVVANAHPMTVTVPLGGSYLSPAGRAESSATLPPHTGQILLSAP